MNITWLCTDPPWPPNAGGRIRSARMLAHVARRHAVTLVTLGEPGTDLGPLPGLCRAVRVIPWPRETAGRLYGLRRALRYPPELATGGAAPALTEALVAAAPDVVHVDGLDALRFIPPGLPYVLSLNDVPSLLVARCAALQPWNPRARLLRWLTGHRVQRYEVAALCSARVTLVVSEHDRAWLATRAPGARLIVVENGVDLAEPADPAAIVSGRILFTGALDWPPNADAAAQLVQHVLPRVRAQCPEAHVVLAGRMPDGVTIAPMPGVTAVLNPPGIAPLLASAQLVAVPLRAGSGTRLKILEALAAGRPVVSTPLGAEGLELAPGRDLLVADLVAPFADAVVVLLRDPARRQALADHGHAAVAARYTWDHVLAPLEQAYRK
jgi:glycosyltransferase involved in cell wall biosynthesis